MPLDTLTVLDTEASGFGPKSFPVSFGFAKRNMLTGAFQTGVMVVRDDEWLKHGDWCPKAEEIHGITKEEIRDTGRPPSEVCEWLNDNIGLNAIAYIGDPKDRAWLSQAFDMAGRGMLFQTVYINRLLTNFRASQDLYFSFLEKSHNAADDALKMAEAIMRTIRSPYQAAP